MHKNIYVHLSTRNLSPASIITAFMSWFCACNETVVVMFVSQWCFLQDSCSSCSTKHSRWVAGPAGICLRIIPVCNRTWTYYFPQNCSAFHLIPFGLANRNSVQLQRPPPATTNWYTSSKEWWVGRDCSHLCSVGYSLPASQPACQPS